MQINANSHLNLSPLKVKAPTARVECPSLPGDCVTTSVSSTPSWAKAGLLAMGVLAGATGIAAQCQAQEVQVQDFTGVTSLLQDFSQAQSGQTRFYMHIGLIGQDVEIDQQQAAEHLAQGTPITMRTQTSQQLHSGLVQSGRPESLSIPLHTQTQLSSVDQLREMMASQSPAASTSELQHLTKVLNSYQGVHGNYYYELKDVQHNAAGDARVKPGDVNLSTFEAAQRLLDGKDVALSATLKSEIIHAHSESFAPRVLHPDVQIINDQSSLLSLPPSFNAAREDWHPSIPGRGHGAEVCVKLVTPEETSFHCDLGILRD